MRRHSVIWLAMAVVAFTWLWTASGLACTGLLINRPVAALMAVNYDWEVPGGRLVVNPHGLQKTALVREEQTPLSWVSTYGSVTLNQYGREFPIGGVNQRGLAMQVLWLESTTYPANRQGPAVGALQWVQYCLDSFSTVDQVVESARELAISSRAPLHFLACTPTGACAVIEFVNGVPAIRAKEELPLPVLANSTYSESIKALDASLGYGGTVVPTEGDGSLSRFVRAATQLNETRVETYDAALNRAFDILDDLAIEGRNQWRVVYDLRRKTVVFTTSDNPRRRSISLGDLDLHCAVASARSVDLSAEGAGDVTEWLAPLDTPTNLALIRRSVSATPFLKGTSDEQMTAWATYPEGTRCVMPAPRATPTHPFGAPQAPKD